MKNVSKLGKALSKAEQKEVTGGIKFGQYICIAPYLIEPEETCIPGYHLHPQGHCICCRD